MLMILARLVRSESFWAVVKVRSPHTGPEFGYPRRRGRHGSKGGLGVYHSLLGGRGRRVAVKEGGGLVGGTCEHCEDRAPSGPRQDSVRTLSGLSGQVREVHKPGSALISSWSATPTQGPRARSA